MSNTEPKMLSNRAFGLIFSAIFMVFSIYPVLFGNGLRLWTLIISLLFLSTAVLVPSILTPLNKFWVKFGMFMHSIINPILMGLVFFLTVLPTGIIIKCLGKDPMNRKFDNNSKSYWIERKEKISKESFDNQF